MDLIYDFPQANGRDVDMFGVGSLSAVAQALERAGWWGLSLSEHPAPPVAWLDGGGHQALDPLVALGHAAAVTERLRLLTYLVVLPYRNPLALAKAAATVDVLSGGRLVLGVGTGYLKSEFRALGVDFDERNELFDEALDVLAQHWTGEPFSYEGRHFSARDAVGLPAPVQRPIPIWIGGNARITRERVAARAQGWMPLPGPPEMMAVTRTAAISGLEDLASKIAEIRAAAGERADEIEVVHVYQAPGLQDDPAVDADRHLEALAHLAEIGVTKVVLNGPQGISPDAMTEWIHAIADSYI